MQLDHHPKGDEIQDYLKDITGKSPIAKIEVFALHFLYPCHHVQDTPSKTPIMQNVMR